MIFRRYACVRQSSERDCGIAALATVFAQYGRDIPLGEIRERVGTNRVGSSLRGVLEGAAELGWQARAFRGSYESLASAKCPFIAHVTAGPECGHFVVVHRVSPNRIVIADPSIGVLNLPRREFTQKWTGAYVSVTPPKADAHAGVQSHRVGPWRTLFALLVRRPGVLAGASICALGVSVLGTLASFCVAFLLDTVLPQDNRTLLAGLGMVMFVSVALRIVLGLVRQWLSSRMGYEAEASLLEGYLKRVMRLPVGFFVSQRVGSLLAKARDAATVRQAVGGSAVKAILDSLTVVSVLVVMVVWNAPLALISILSLGIMVGLYLLHLRVYKRLLWRIKESEAVRDSHLVEDLRAIETIKTFRMEPGRIEEALGLHHRFSRLMIRYELLGFSANSVSGLVTGLAGFATLWAGGAMVSQQQISIGTLMFFYTMSLFLTAPLETLADAMLKWREALVSVERLQAVEQERPESDGGVALGPVRSGIHCEGLSFRYDRRRWVLQDIDLRVGQGERLAIVGESGAGKTTLAKLLAGLLDPCGGRLSIDGIETTTLTRESLRSRIVLVPQDPVIFTASFRENIACGKPDASMKQIEEVARMSRLHDFIVGVPRAYEAICGEDGRGLSAGQKQRIAIARALLVKPDILIFDEATSHLDPATEEALYEAMAGCLRSTTFVLIAHRISTVLRARRIVVLHQGKIVETGSHRELLEQKGLYYSIYTLQNADGRPEDPSAGASDPPSRGSIHRPTSQGVPA